MKCGVVSCAIAVALTVPAAAQPAAPEVASSAAAPAERHGLFGGGALWLGNISCSGDKCDGTAAAFGGSGHIGYAFTPRLAGVFDVWGLTSSGTFVSLTFAAATVGVRYWVIPKLWLEAGVGSGYARLRVLNSAGNSSAVPVGELGAGYEVAHGSSWVLDVALQAAQGSSANDGSTSTGRMAGAGVHMTWFSHP